MMGVFAEFERGMIQERVRAGLARAKAKGGEVRQGRQLSLIEMTAVQDAAADRMVAVRKTPGVCFRLDARACSGRWPENVFWFHVTNMVQAIAGADCTGDRAD
jgi:DNA invertase Pin-like site-specific DNA recombinase